jgi:ATP phosphoribosyltransferase
MLRIAIQKSGRLNDDSVQLLKECGIRFAGADRKLLAQADNFPLEILYLRDDDIPGYVEDQVADLGIVGENVYAETHKDVVLVEKLGFSKCRLSIALPKNDVYNSVNDLEGKNIATSYPYILGEYLKNHQVNAHIHEISGSVEIAPSIGLAHAICDLVSSGSTLISNGLKEAEVIFKSEAVLLSHHNLSTEKKKILNDLLFRIHSVRKGKDFKYILLNAPNNAIEKICNLLPGMKSPSVLPLATEGWSSIHSVVKENEFWDVIQKLKNAGAEGILVVPIEKMIL